MATTNTKSIVTRIKNKVDTLANWNSATGTLLDGEIALVRVPTGDTYTNPVTGASEPVVELLMKVGQKDSSGNLMAFNNLPWLSAKASDVYNWAKAANVSLDTTDANNAKLKFTDKDNTELKSISMSHFGTASAVSANTQAITRLNNDENTTGSVAYKIKAALDALALEEGEITGEGTFVTTVTQSDGQIAVVRAKIAEADLPQISTAKIYTGDATNDTLAKMLDDIYAKIAGFAGGLKIEDKKDTDGNAITGNFIKNVEYADGKFTLTRGGIELTDVPVLDTDHLGDASVTTAKIEDNAVTDAKIDTVSAGKVYYPNTTDNAKKTLVAKIDEIEGRISGIDTAIAGGVHFIGEVNEAPYTKQEEGGETKTYAKIKTIDADGTVKYEERKANAGDIVVYLGTDETDSTLTFEKEYISTGSTWQELGDLSRVGRLETWREKLVSKDTAQTNKFVTAVAIAEDGTVTVSKQQPTSEDVSHSNSTVAAVLSDHTTKLTGLTSTTVQGSINAAISALNHQCTTTGNWVKNVTQENGVVTVTKENLPTASTSANGITTLSSATDSTDEDKAATPKAVKTAYDLADEAAANASNAQQRVSVVEADYIHLGTADTNGYSAVLAGKDNSAVELIFDCGGAPQA